MLKHPVLIERNDTDTVAVSANDKKFEQEQLINLSEAFANLGSAKYRSWMGQTGVIGLRGYARNEAFDGDHRMFHAPFAALNIHDHSNYNSMGGIGEQGLMVNGEYVQTRHIDYRLRKSVVATSDVLGSEYVYPPALKASVAAKPTGVTGDTVDTAGDTQARYISRIFEDNPEDIRMLLAFGEFWYEITDGGTVTDKGSSWRHADRVQDLHQRYEFSESTHSAGNKDRFENLSFGPAQIKGLDEEGNPVIAVLQFRMRVVDIGSMADVAASPSAPIVTIGTTNHSHITLTQMTDEQAADLRAGSITEVDLTSTDSGHDHTYRITWNGSEFVGVDLNTTHQHPVIIETGYTGEVPYDKAKALAGTIDSENVFTAVREELLEYRYNQTQTELMDTPHVRFRVKDLDRMLERAPGLDGEGASINEVYTNPDTGEDTTYLDRDGGPLNSAYYHRRYQQTANDAAGRVVADRGFNDTSLFISLNTKVGVYKNVSYAVPFEIIAQLPKWNPYNFSESDFETVNASGAGTQGDPYDAYADENYYYLTPYAMYTEGGTVDPADTAGSVWIESGIDSVARRVWSSGIRPFTHDNVHRMRWPVAPIYQEGSYEATQLAIMREKIEAIPVNPVTELAEGSVQTAGFTPEANTSYPVDLSAATDPSSTNISLGGNRGRIRVYDQTRSFSATRYATLVGLIEGVSGSHRLDVAGGYADLEWIDSTYGYRLVSKP